jgi:hypothetical protein
MMSIDVMAVRNSQSVINVVNNFDLTFCQIWYTGEHIFASHPNHILERKGVLQGDYTKTFMEGNVFLARRMMKYRRRGFEIHLDPAFATTGVLPAIKDKDPEEYTKYFESDGKKVSLITKNIFHKITDYVHEEIKNGYDSDEYDSISKLREVSRSSEVIDSCECDSKMLLEESIVSYYGDMYYASLNSPLGKIHFEWVKNYISFVSLTGDVDSKYILNAIGKMELPNPSSDLSNKKRHRTEMDDEDLTPPEVKRPRMS